MDVAAWLNDLGMAVYAGSFTENDITPELLATLTREDLEDLEELGVLSLGGGWRERQHSIECRWSPRPNEDSN